jgi:hypothetical protein
MNPRRMESEHYFVVQFQPEIKFSCHHGGAEDVDDQLTYWRARSTRRVHDGNDERISTSPAWTRPPAALKLTQIVRNRQDGKNLAGKTKQYMFRLSSEMGSGKGYRNIMMMTSERITGFYGIVPVPSISEYRQHIQQSQQVG